MKEKKEQKIKIEDGGLGYVKGYDMRTVTLKKLEKGKLGDALSAVVNMELLENEIKQALADKCPVWGYFKKGQMWSCFIFERAAIEKSAITPAPETPNETLQMFRLKGEYVHPDVTPYYEKMKAGIFSGIKAASIDTETDLKKAFSPIYPDGFIWGDDTYVLKKTKGGEPAGLLLGIGIAFCFGMAFDNFALGICLGMAIGLSVSVSFSQGELIKVEETAEAKESESEKTAAAPEHPDSR